MDKQHFGSSEIRAKNRSDIFRLFRQSEKLCRQSVVSGLGLSLPTVTHYLQELQREGLILRSGSIGCAGGRRANAYCLNDRARTAIGLDVARNHATAAALDLRGNILTSVRRNLSFSRTDAYFQELGHLVRETVRAAQLEPEGILGVGIAVPGLLTPDKQALSYCGVLDFSNVTLAELSRYIPYPTALCHDTDAAGFAEIWNNPDTTTAFYLMLSDSIGGSVYIDGQPFEGQNLRAGEVGHLLLVPGGKPCYCGHRGCMDAYCSAGVLTAAAGRSLERFFHLLKLEDPRITVVWQEYLEHLARTVGYLRMLFDCDIILGGYVGSHMAPYMDSLRALAARYDPFEDRADYLLPCRYKTEPVAAGAALGYISAFLEQV